ncbi:MAG: hypothetical protein AB8F26_07185 [Phycisphaerales bacterium]
MSASCQMTTRRQLRAIPLALVAFSLVGCSVRPMYQIRIDNSSSGTVIAQLARDVSFDDDQVLGQVRVRAGDEATLGPVSADPLQRVELLVSRPGDLQSLPEKLRVSRGSWTATVTDAPISTWSRFRVQLTKSDEPIAETDADSTTSD